MHRRAEAEQARIAAALSEAHRQANDELHPTSEVIRDACLCRQRQGFQGHDFLLVIWRSSWEQHRLWERHHGHRHHNLLLLRLSNIP